MKVSDFDYELPEELIAQDPLADRTASRLMCVDKKSGAVSHHVFSEIGDFLKEGDCLVINNTKVIPARLYGKRATGGQAEVLLLKRLGDESAASQTGSAKDNAASQTGSGSAKEGADDERLFLTRNTCVWECLVRPGKKCRIGAEIFFGNGELKAVVEDVVGDGNRIIRFYYDGIFEEVLDVLGEMPLPPYITHKLADKTRYQTVYAKYDGSAAAPTAGLHFTKELLDGLKQKGIRVAEITLHVGLGTFRPVKVEDTSEHKMHSEYYSITPEAAAMINGTKAAGGRVIAVGTTSTRTLESAAGDDGLLPAEGAGGWTDIFIQPGYEFKVIDGLITNFHLPKSTLVMLVSAFAGREHVLAAYREAVREKYRFFSFGDAMFLR